MVNYTFDQLKELIVLISLIIMAFAIFICSYLIPAEFNQEFYNVFSLIIGGLLGIAGPQAAKLLNKKEYNVVPEKNEDTLQDFHKIEYDEPLFDETK